MRNENHNLVTVCGDTDSMLDKLRKTYLDNKHLWHTINTDTGFTSLQQAIYLKETKTALFFIENSEPNADGFNLEAKLDKIPPDGYCPLTLAVTVSHYLLSKNPDINSFDQKVLPVVTALLKKGANPNRIISKGEYKDYTPFHVAIINGRVKCASEILPYVKNITSTISLSPQNSTSIPMWGSIWKTNKGRVIDLAEKYCKKETDFIDLLTKEYNKHSTICLVM